MKRNFFGDMRLQPGDDLYACWNDEFGPEDPAIPVYAREITEEPEFGWTCSLNDDDGNESEVHDFGSKDELVAWLLEQTVKIEGYPI